MGKLSKIIIVILVIYIIGLGGYLVYDKVLKKDSSMQERPIDKPKDEPIVKSREFNYNLILNNHAIAEKNKNYLISPYSIEIALNMLRDGASGDTKTEIDKVIGKRKINDVIVKDKVNVANAIFIKNKHENNVLSSYKNNLETNYHAEMFVDEFKSPDKINDWVKEKTMEMIPKISDDLNPNFVLGLVNAIAMKVEWQEEFDCNRTISEEFTKVDGSKINVEMMHDYGYKYVKEEKVEGIVLPYKKYDNSNVELEFVGLIPTGNLDDYINNNFESDVKNLNNLIKTPINNASKEQIINLSLPRFKYESGIKEFISLLQNMGIKRSFVSGQADFSNMVQNVNDLYVDQAVHKTFIELDEKGTKAAAATGFSTAEKSAGPTKQYEYIDIKFNKPFIYLIREKNTNEILFFGVVYEPNLWNGSTCDKGE